MYDWHSIVGVIAGLMAALAIIPYIRDIVYGTTRPNIVSWSLWVLLLVIAVAAQVSAGASWSLVFLVGDLIGTSTVFLLCLAGYGYGKYGLLEAFCFLLALVAIVWWQLTDQPIIAILLAAAADFLAAVPTLVKAYKDPESEDPTQFFVIALAALLGLLSTTVVDPANLIFATYLFGINGAIGATAYVRARRINKIGRWR